uniref:Leucine-rich repeat-containing protein 59 n=1 Tax=Culex pipiens TaxID=7175 RepID=A0A8D8JG29_CULPI
MSKKHKSKIDESEKINVREKLNHNVLDLSLMNISSVPVNEIKTLKRATILDLSNNVISIINTDFTSLIQLTKIDLSKNKIRSIADDFGNLINLRHLDLYDNQIERLPLSFGRLKKLKYLDLKNNPLNPVFSKIIGTCTDQKDCIEAARKAVAFMADIEQQVIEDRRKERELREVSEVKIPSETTNIVEGVNKPDKRKKTKAKKNSIVNNATEEIVTKSKTNSNHVSTTELRPQKQNESKTCLSKIINYTVLFIIVSFICIGLIFLLKPELINNFLYVNDMDILEEFIK